MCMHDLHVRITNGTMSQKVGNNVSCKRPHVRVRMGVVAKAMEAPGATDPTMLLALVFMLATRSLPSVCPLGRSASVGNRICERIR